MLNEALAFERVVPKTGFRWIFRDPKGQWDFRVPPDDWPDTDYQAAGFHRRKPKVAHRFYVAASSEECLEARAALVVAETDLYLSFGSKRPTPAVILDFANRYGMLRYSTASFSIRKSQARKLLAAFGRSLIFPSDSKRLFLAGETALDWMKAFDLARSHLMTWTELEAEGKGMQGLYLEEVYNRSADRNLNFRVKTGKKTRNVEPEVVASSLAAAIEIQWGMSIASNVIHRQCAQCPNWFAVHPDAGRPEKHFCSDACRMRAYRRRNLVKQSGSTNRSTKRKT